MPDVVESYLQAIVAHDWGRLGETLTPDVVRTGPYFDVFEGRDSYVAFISKLMPALPNYSMQIKSICYVDDGRRAYAELAETVDVDGAAHTTPEVLVFEITDNCISAVDIFIKRKT